MRPERIVCIILNISESLECHSAKHGLNCCHRPTMCHRWAQVTEQFLQSPDVVNTSERRLRGRGLQCLQPGVGTETETCGQTRRLGRGWAETQTEGVEECDVWLSLLATGAGPGQGHPPTQGQLRLRLRHSDSLSAISCHGPAHVTSPDIGPSSGEYWAQVQNSGVISVHPDPRPRSQPQL